MSRHAKFGDGARRGHDVTVRRRVDGISKEKPGCTLYVNAGEGEDQGKRCRLEAGAAVFGRDEDCDLCVVDKNVSRKHVRFELVPEGILVQDLGSMNGIEHLGRRAERVVLAHHLATQITGLSESPLSTASQEYLMRQNWPGNVRQLRNAIERMLALRMEVGGGESQLVGLGTDFHDFTAETTLPEADPLPPFRDSSTATSAARTSAVRTSAAPGEALPPFRDAREAAVSVFELDYLSRLWSEAEGNVSRAARAAGIDRKYLRKLLKRHGLYG